MDQLDGVKKGLFGAGALALLVFAYAAFSMASSYSKSVQPGNYRSFAVSGEGKVTAKNDIALFTYSVNIEGGKDIAAIKKESSDKTAKILAFLKAQGVDEKDITTTSYNLEPRYQYFSCPQVPNGGVARPCPPQEIVGYTLSQTDSVKIRDLAKADKVVGGVVENGANNVSQLTFTVDNQNTLQTQAKGLAIKQAIERAKVLAETAGFRVGRIISIDDNGYSPVARDMYAAGSMKLQNAVPESAPNLNPGSGDITANVVVRFEIK